MISKPLFKQSCKANATIWSFVTVITCAMLAAIILVLGNLNVGGIRDSMVDMFVEDAIESSINKQSMTYFNMTENALINYDDNNNQLNYLFNVQMSDKQKTELAQNYEFLKTQGMTHEDICLTILSNVSDEQTKLATEAFLNYYSKQGADYSETKISEYVLLSIEDIIYDELIETEGQASADSAKQFISQAINDYIIQKQINNYEATEFASTYIPAVLKNIFIEQSFKYQDDTIFINEYFTAEEIEEKSLSAITMFRAQSDIKKKQLEEQYKNQENSSAIIANELAEYRLSYIEQTSGGLLDDLPKDVSEALMELGGMNIYSLVIGEIFYRIAGLLLPIIFVIMCSNNLISSQVDSGSMAYVLSTPTKRKSVVLTQLTYLILAIFSMCCLTTLTNVICLALVKSSEITLTYSQIILFNVGLFITLFAISGICFLASCWFNRSKQAMSIGGGLSMFFLVATILGLFGSQVIPSAIRIKAMNYFNYVSVITLFDTMSIIDGTITFLWKWIILIAIGIVTFTAGAIKFNKKDLPL